MKILAGCLVAVVCAMPVLAQGHEEHGGGPPQEGMRGMGMGGQRGGMMRGPIDQLREALSQASLPLSADQEKKLKPIAEEQEKARMEMMDRMRAQRGDGGGRGMGRDRGDGVPGGGRGPGGGGFGGGPMGDAMRRMSDEFNAKVAPILTSEQAAVWKKYQNDQIKARGGFEALKLNMEEAGAPITAEQEPQIRDLFQELNQQRGQLFRESQGRPDEAKLKELETANMAKVVRLLNPAQRKALLEARRRQQ